MAELSGGDWRAFGPSGPSAADLFNPADFEARLSEARARRRKALAEREGNREASPGEPPPTLPAAAGWDRWGFLAGILAGAIAALIAHQNLLGFPPAALGGRNSPRARPTGSAGSDFLLARHRRLRPAGPADGSRERPAGGIPRSPRAVAGQGRRARVEAPARGTAAAGAAPNAGRANSIRQPCCAFSRRRRRRPGHGWHTHHSPREGVRRGHGSGHPGSGCRAAPASYQSVCGRTAALHPARSGETCIGQDPAQPRLGPRPG